MSKLNKTQKRVPAKVTVQAVAAANNTTVAVSANGNLQFLKTEAQALYEDVVGGLYGTSTAFKSSDALVQNVRENVKKCVDAGMLDFVANLALHARSEMNIRTLPVMLVVEFAKAIAEKRQTVLNEIKNTEAAPMNDNIRKRLLSALKARAESQGYAHMRQLVTDVIQRADQITDLYAYALSVFGTKNAIPLAVKRGVADAFNKFGEYHYGKYKNSGSLTFKDVLRIVHPKADSEKRGEVFAKIMSDSLAVPYTWESLLSANGQKSGKEKLSDKQLWTQLVSSGKVGYMALIRNLRNIIQAQLDSDVYKQHVLDVIADPARVQSSKQLPMDLLQAYSVVRPLCGKAAEAVSKAIDASVANMPHIGNHVWIICDFSGSMGEPWDNTQQSWMSPTPSRDNMISAIDTATFLAASLIKSAGKSSVNLAVTLFGSSAKTVSIDASQSVVKIREALLKYRVGGISGATNFRAALAEGSSLGFTPDTVLVCTDGEINRFPFSGKLPVNTAPNAVKMAFNFSASRTTPFAQSEGWYSAAGWSSATLQWIPAVRDKISVIEALSVPYVGLKSTQTDE